MSEALVVVPVKPPRHQREFWFLVVAACLWGVEGLTELALSFGFALPRWLAFMGAAAGLLFAGMSLVLRLAAPETLSGFRRLDRSTRNATWRER